MAGLQTSVRYASDGTSAVWHVPFPFASPADVGVKRIAADGRERRLTQGTDYVVSGGSVMCVVPAGESIVIWLDAPVEAALTAARAAALTSGGTASLTSGGMAGTAATMTATGMTGTTGAMTATGMTGMTGAAATGTDTALVETLTRLAESLETQTRRQEEAEAETRTRLAGEAEALLERSREAAREAAVSSVSAEAATQAETLRRTAESLRADLRGEAEAAARTADEALTRATLAGERLEAATSSMNAASATLSDAAARGQADVRGAADSATRAVREAQSAALAHIGAAARTAVNATLLSSGTGNAEALLVTEADIPAGTEIPLPDGLSYQPGRGMLMAFYQGCALALGRQFEEVGGADATSDRVRLRFAVAAGDELLFRVIATNSRAELEAITNRAEAAADEAEGFAKDAEASAGKAEQAREKAGDAQWYAEQWADNAATSAEQSHGSAQCAWEAARQAAIAAQPDRPGLAAVSDVSALDGALAGAYLLNPFLRHRLTPFMGLWPVQAATADAATAGGASGDPAGEGLDWDGFFFLGPAYPDTPVPPPLPSCTQKPQKPEDPTAPPDGGDPDDPDGSGSGSDGSTVVWGPCRK